MDVFSFKNAYLKCIEEQLRDALNDQGRLGMIYRGLTKYIMAKYGGSTTLLQIKIAAYIHSPTTRTIVLLTKNKVQIMSFYINFYKTCMEIEKNEQNKYTNSHHHNKLTHKNSYHTFKAASSLINSKR